MVTPTSGIPSKAVEVITPVRNALAKRSSSPYVVSEGSIAQPPACMSSSPDCPFTSDLLQTCYCKVSFIWCWSHGYKEDISCICQPLNDNTCTSSCKDINYQLYLGWLNATCAVDPSWTSLGANWSSKFTDWDVLVLGRAFDPSKEADLTYNAVSPFTSSSTEYDLTEHPPACTRAGNYTWFNGFWNSSLVDGDVATGMDYNLTVGVLYLDRTLFCTPWTIQDMQSNSPGMCNSTLETTGLLTWINRICGNVTNANTLPADWTNELVVLNDTYPYQHNFTWPSCLSAGKHCNLNVTEENCTSTRCVVDHHGNCAETLAVDLECFCSSFEYGTTCAGACGLSWERKSYLHWLNSTCFPIRNGTGLPSNWTTLLNVQREELLPWQWEIISDNIFNRTLSNGTIIQVPANHCPSTTSKLAAFAAVNIAMAFLLPFLGRRTVIKKLTFGIFGRQESQRWWLTGPVAVGLHLASNAVNAVIIQRTPGFSKTSITDLTFSGVRDLA